MDTLRRTFITLLLSLSGLAPLPSLGQSVATSTRSWGVAVGYYGETITHYGLKVGVERSFHQWSHVKRSGRIKTYDVIGGLALAAFRHPYNHYGLIAQTELGLRRTKSRGAVFEVGLSGGYLRTVLDGETYQVADNGSLARIRFAGRNALLVGLYTAWGKDFSRTTNLPLLCRIKPALLLQTPYNTGVLLRFALEIGVVYRFNQPINRPD